MKAQRLEKEFRQRSVGTGSDRLVLSAADALQFISRAAEEGVPILGISVGASGSGNAWATADQIDYSAEVSQGHGCWAEAEAFIRERTTDKKQFEVILGDDPVEAV